MIYQNIMTILRFFVSSIPVFIISFGFKLSLLLIHQDQKSTMTFLDFDDYLVPVPILVSQHCVARS